MTLPILLAIGAVTGILSVLSLRARRHCYAGNRAPASSTAEKWIPEQSSKSEVSPAATQQLPAVPGIPLGKYAKPETEVESTYNHSMLELAPEEFDAIVEAAIAGNPAAQHIVGRACEKGVIKQKNELQAIEWYQLAANRGHMPAIKKVVNWSAQ